MARHMLSCLSPSKLDEVTEEGTKLTVALAEMLFLAEDFARGFPKGFYLLCPAF